MSELDVRCGVISELATRYLERALPGPQQVNYETHLVFCTSCMTFLSDMRGLRVRLGELPLDPVDGEERRRIVAAAAGGR